MLAGAEKGMQMQLLETWASMRMVVPCSTGIELSNRRWSIERVTQHVRASFSAERQAAMSIHLRMGPIATVLSLLQSAEFSTWHMRTRVLPAGDAAPGKAAIRQLQRAVTKMLPVFCTSLKLKIEEAQRKGRARCACRMPCHLSFSPWWMQADPRTNLNSFGNSTGMPDCPPPPFVKFRVRTPDLSHTSLQL